jgi:hypothetical protein
MRNPNAARLIFFPIFNDLNCLTDLGFLFYAPPNRGIEQHSAKAHTYHVCRTLCTAVQKYARAHINLRATRCILAWFTRGRLPHEPARLTKNPAKLFCTLMSQV